MKEFYVIPTIGQFKVTITPNYDFYNRTKINNYVLNVGGQMDKCVNITIHSEDSNKKEEMILSWAEVIGKNCTVDSEIIRGDATVKMVELAFTIAKEIAPYAKYISLQDMSFFNCKTPNGIKKVSLPPYYIAFNDKTWYEDKFKAVLSNDNDYIQYKKCIKSLYSENIKPSYFNFGNNSLKEILLPLYLESKTWKDFFNLIDLNYPDTKCVLMYPWIDSAFSMIFKENGCTDLYTGKEWKIDLKHIPKIHYYQINSVKKGGKAIQSNQYDNYRNIDYNNVMKWDYIKIINKNKRNRTNKKR
jgi:hypothetical protein